MFKSSSIVRILDKRYVTECIITSHNHLDCMPKKEPAKTRVLDI
jgi:hypothetical protein